MLRFADVSCGGDQFIHRADSHGIDPMADVERDLGRCGDDIGRVGLVDDLSDSHAQVLAAPAAFIAGDDELRSGHQRIGPQVHRCRPGVSGLAGEREPQPTLPGNRGDHTHRQRLPLEQDALLDVHFDITEESGGIVSGVRNGLGNQAEIFHGLPHRDAAFIRPRKPGRVEASRHGVTAEVRQTESHAFLLAESEDIEVKRQDHIAKCCGTGNAGENTHRPIVLAAVGDGIQMRADEQDRCITSNGALAADQVAGLIDTATQSRCLHPVGDELVRLPHRMAGEGAGDRAGFIRACRQQLAAVPHLSAQWQEHGGVLIGGWGHATHIRMRSWRTILSMVREHIHLRINGQPHRVTGDDAFLSLSDFLRLRLGMTGTKIVCSEGDCGACTVLVAKWSRDESDSPLHYKPMDSCITWMFQLDHAHVVSIEGLADGDKLHPVQKAMVECHGSQCGFCTPGFVMAMTGLLEHANACGDDCVDDQALRIGLTGNLCRCTGYVQILDAARAVDPRTLQMVASRHPAETIHAAWEKETDSISVHATPERKIHIPSTLKEALEFLRLNPTTKIISGATDVGVQVNKGLISLATILYVGGLSELRAIHEEDGKLTIGAGATWSQVIAAVEKTLPAFAEILSLFGAPQIRNAGTIGGNIVNGSSIADSLPFLFVSDAQLRLVSARGERRVGIADFFLGYKRVDIKPGELLVDITFGPPASDQILRLYKVSRRRDLDIATFTAAVLLTMKQERIENARVAYGGVGPVVLRLARTEAMLKGQVMTEDLMREAGLTARAEIAPLSDVRASAQYRLTLAQTILLKVYHEALPMKSHAAKE